MKILEKGTSLLAVVAAAAIAGCSCGTCCRAESKKAPARISVFAAHVYEVMKKRGMTMQQAVDAFKAAGVTGFDGAYVDPRLEELVAAGLEPAMVYGVMSFRDPSKDEVEQNRYLERAKKLGAKYMMIVPDHMTGIKDDPSDPVYEREFLKTMDGLKRLVAKCMAAGICPLLEDFGYRSNPGSHFCNLKRYFAEIPDLRFALDTGNVMFSDRGTDIMDVFDYFHAKIRHVHVKDHPSGGPQAYAQPGQGVVPNEKMLRQLFSEGYDGWVTLELFGAPDMLDAVVKTCAFVNSCR